MGVFDVDNTKLSIREKFTYEVEIVDNIRIPLKDGITLSARLWFPKGLSTVRGTILEYLPYRKDEFTALRDSIRHPYFAGHGYACLRVDIRGSGDSEGIMDDEYSPQEQSDCLEVFDWICAQPWSSGNIAMIGKSWGGFNGLQMAALNHPALKTVISLYSTDDRYADDVHYKGGTLMGSDMLWWASTMLAYNARPPIPQYYPGDWKAAWRDRIENTPPLVEKWVEHQSRDSYWQHGSICEDYSAIKIPVFLIGGWADGYTNAVFRMMDNLTVPKRGLIGPWTHEFPDVAIPGPQIGYLQECLSWFSIFLDNDGDRSAHHDEFLIYLQDSVEPKTSHTYRTGKWIDLWASQPTMQDWFTSLKHQQPLSNYIYHGLYSGVFCPFGQEGDLPDDQSIDNALATTLLYQTLDNDLAIAGRVNVKLRLKSDKPQATIHLRISDVHPNGKKTLVTFAPFNLCHYKGHDKPENIPVNEWFDVEFLLDGIGYIIPKGHNIEVSCSPSYWPQIWPSREKALLTVDLSHSQLNIPVVTHPVEASLPHASPETAAPLTKEVIREGTRTRHIIHKLETKSWILSDYSDEGLRTLPSNGITYGSDNHNTYFISEEDPLSAHVVCTWTLDLSDQDMQTHLETYSKMSADYEYFYLHNRITAYENEEIFTEKEWNIKIKRKFV